jgi:hypothetical protein
MYFLMNLICDVVEIVFGADINFVLAYYDNVLRHRSCEDNKKLLWLTSARLQSYDTVVKESLLSSKYKGIHWIKWL